MLEIDAHAPRRGERRRLVRVVVERIQRGWVNTCVAVEAVVDDRRKVDVVVEREVVGSGSQVVVDLVGTKGVPVQLKRREADVARITRVEREGCGRHAVHSGGSTLHSDTRNHAALVGGTVVPSPKSELHFEVG